tara:strand:+ start:916 stop:2019 length:1104 start_codon:yes stop_codon:yes gene_type:complete
MVLALVGVFALTLAGWWISRSTGIGRQLGATMVVLLLGFLVTNAIGWQPQAAAAAWVTGPLTSLAITQLLLAVDLRRILPEAQRLFAPFLVAVVSTLSAVLLGAVLLNPWLQGNSPVLAGIYTATFTGGSLNFVSVARTLQPPEPLLLMATAADHVVFAAWFGFSILIGRRWGRTGESSSKLSQRGDLAAPSRLTASRILLSLLWGGAVLWAAELMTALIQRGWSGCPSILVLTTMALVAAQLPGASSRAGCYGLGLLLIQPFFTVIGLSSPVAGLLGSGWPVFFYAAWIVAVQGGLLLLLRQWQRWPLVESLVASQAAIGGPSTALALATSLDRPALAMPGVAIGLLGYLIGTYLGLFAAFLLGFA